MMLSHQTLNDFSQASRHSGRRFKCTVRVVRHLLILGNKNTFFLKESKLDIKAIVHKSLSMKNHIEALFLI